MKCPKSPARPSKRPMFNHRASPKTVQQTSRSKLQFTRLEREKALFFLALNLPKRLLRAVLTLLPFPILPVLSRRTIRCSDSKGVD